jgi:hypothetical protein
LIPFACLAPVLPPKVWSVGNQSVVPGAHHTNWKSGNRRLIDGTLPLSIGGSTHPGDRPRMFVRPGRQ